MYDYIIVGGGSAGCVMANRLSEDPSKRVCLLEAGPKDKSPFIHMAIGIAFLANSKKVNWAFDTAPQEHLNNRKLFWPRGKTLGGSSSINAMLYIRGHEKDYDYWQQATGSNVWGWDRACEVFRRFEDNHRLGSDGFHGQGGELSVSDLKDTNPLSLDFVKAGMELQYPHNDDFNGASQEGVGLYQVTQKNGQRWSSAMAFLRDAESRHNLDILTNAHVTRVLMKDKRAVGVALRQKSEELEIKLNPNGEVILSGGAVNSPQLLLLSGIGEAQSLKAKGIDVVHDLPEVGHNMADHLDVTLMHQAANRKPIGIAPAFLPRAVAGLFQYVFKRDGFLTSNVAEAGGFLKSSPDRDRPNLQIHFLPCYLNDHGRQLTYGWGYTTHICDLLPKSRGFIGLSSADPMADPLIQPNYLSDPEDVETMVSGFKIVRRILEAPAMAANSKAEVRPGPQVWKDEDIVDFIRDNAETIYHPVGTCRMGNDAASVVDPELKVRGVEGLRVIDASVMPSLIAGNTNAPTMMIAQNAADIVLGKVQI